MAAEVFIFGPLKFLGYQQTNAAGSLNGQALIYRNGFANWESLPSTDASVIIDTIVTSLDENDAFVNIDGDELIFDDTDYIGIDTISPIETEHTIVSVNNTAIDNPNFITGDNLDAVIAGSNVTLNVNTSGASGVQADALVTSLLESDIMIEGESGNSLEFSLTTYSGFTNNRGIILDSTGGGGNSINVNGAPVDNANLINGSNISLGVSGSNITIAATTSGTITQVENDGVRIGNDTLDKINFDSNITATLDPSDSTTAIITAQGGITCIDGGNIGLTDANFPINFDAGTI